MTQACELEDVRVGDENIFCSDTRYLCYLCNKWRGSIQYSYGRNGKWIPGVSKTIEESLNRCDRCHTERLDSCMIQCHEGGEICLNCAATREIEMNSRTSHIGLPPQHAPEQQDHGPRTSTGTQKPMGTSVNDELSNICKGADSIGQTRMAKESPENVLEPAKSQWDQWK